MMLPDDLIREPGDQDVPDDGHDRQRERQLARCGIAGQSIGQPHAGTVDDGVDRRHRGKHWPASLRPHSRQFPVAGHLRDGRAPLGRRQVSPHERRPDP